jgi:hypothetical protein
MSARFTVDTNILRIRNVIALNPQTDAFIPSYTVPMTGEKGCVCWYSGLDFLSSISVPTLSTNVRNVIETIIPGLSTYSTIVGSSINLGLASTTAGLGSAGYASTTYIESKITQLSQTYRYISATTLYECFKNLANMQKITDELGPMALINVPSLANGYVSTINPGQYTLLTSSMGLLGSNLQAMPFNNLSNLTAAQVDIAGYSSRIVNTSKMTVDIMPNATMTWDSALGGTAYVSTFLTQVGANTPIGTPVTFEVPAGTTSLPLSQLRFLLSPTNLTPWPGALQLHITQSNAADTLGTVTTNVGKNGGIFVTLNNMD